MDAVASGQDGVGSDECSRANARGIPVLRLNEDTANRCPLCVLGLGHLALTLRLDRGRGESE